MESAVSNFIESKYKSPFNIVNKEGYIIRFLALNKISFLLESLIFSAFNFNPEILKFQFFL